MNHPVEDATLTTAAGGEDRLSLILEAAPSAMLVVNGQGRVVVANSEAERSFGYSAEELLALRVEVVDAKAEPVVFVLWGASARRKAAQP